MKNRYTRSQNRRDRSDGAYESPFSEKSGECRQRKIWRIEKTKERCCFFIRRCFGWQYKEDAHDRCRDTAGPSINPKPVPFYAPKVTVTCACLVVVVVVQFTDLCCSHPALVLRLARLLPPLNNFFFVLRLWHCPHRFFSRSGHKSSVQEKLQLLLQLQIVQCPRSLHALLQLCSRHHERRRRHAPYVSRRLTCRRSGRWWR
mmetsp:Transcript_87605/g.169743  ORF Transcript_87605/g.169743 Transcript_87605/m.169743 type:complete len:202 (-) Transcript_87605:246-851(-)